MKRRLIIFAAIMSLVFLQTSFVAALFGPDRTPDILLMLAMAATRVIGFEASLGWSVIAGVIYDSATLSKTGTHVLQLLALVYLVSFFSRRFAADANAGGFLLAAGWVLVATLLSRFAHALYWQETREWAVLARDVFVLKAVLFQWLANGALFFAGVGIFKFLRGRFSPAASLALK